MTNSKPERIRATICISLVFLGFAAIGVRLYLLQVRNAKKYRVLAHKQHQRKRDLKPWRGDIYLREQGKPVLVAASVGRHSLLIHGRQRDPQALLAQLTNILKLNMKEQQTLQRKLARKRAFWYKRRRISNQQAAKIRQRLKSLVKTRHPKTGKDFYKAKLSGLEVYDESVRLYPFGNLASHVLGLVDVDGKGLSGIERSFNDQLKGLSGLEEFEVDNRRRQLADIHTTSVEARPGYSVVLTLDRRIQHFAEEAASKAFDHWQPESISIVAVEPDTGKVLALACKPDFDPQDLSTSKLEHRRNRLLTDPYEPGSTIKPLIIARIWDLGRGHPESPIELPLRYRTTGRRKPIVDTHKVRVKERETRQKDIVTQSSNVGSFLLSTKLSPDEMLQTFRSFGLGEPTNVPLNGEHSGFMALAKKLHNNGNRAAVAQGYGIMVTALQMVMAYAALGNGGTLYKSRLVHELRHPNGQLAKRFDPQPIARVVSKKVAQEWLGPALKAVVESKYGTARRNRIKEYSMAGKTGTSKKLVPDPDNPKKRIYSPSRTVCSFLGYAPANHPKLAIAVVVNDPTLKHGRTFGGNVAGPIAAEVVKRTLLYLGVKPRPDRKAKTTLAHLQPPIRGWHSENHRSRKRAARPTTKRSTKAKKRARD